MTATATTTDGIKRQIRESWDHGAVDYDEQYGHGLKSASERDAWLQLLRRLLPPDQPQRVLDVGAGTGFLALLLAELGHQVTALDISEGMMEVGRQKARRAGLRVEFRAGDADAPPFEDAAFDAVVSRHLLWTLLEPERAVRQWRRVTRPGGQVLSIDGLWRSPRLVDRAAVRAGYALRRVLGRQRHHGGGYPHSTSGRLPLMGLRTIEPARNAFLRAGLRDVRVEELTRLDAVERAAMPLVERLANRYTRYLVEGTV
jgi:ubiquinone/menaquinone biosynthesis C-methylase UbiE